MFAYLDRRGDCDADQTAEKVAANMVIQKSLEKSLEKSLAGVTREIFSRRKQFRLAAIRKLADALRAYREENGLSIAHLSELTGVPSSVISRAERGIAISIGNRYKINKKIGSDGADKFPRS